MSEAVAEFQEESTAGEARDLRLLTRHLGYVRPYWRMALVAIGLIITSSLLQLVGPLATAMALDLYIRPSAGRILSPAAVWLQKTLMEHGLTLTPGAGLALLSAIFLGSLVLAFLVLYAQAFVMNLMGQYIMFDLRGQIFERLQRLPVRFFDRNPIGRLVTRVTNDVDSLNELFTAGLVSIFGDVVLLGGIVLVLFWLNWRLALVTFAILPLLALLTVWFKIRARQSYREVRVRLARINSFLQEHLTGMSVIQLFNREQPAFEAFAEIDRDHRDANVRAIFYYALYYPGVELITAVGTALILWYGGARVLSGAISVGALVAFLQYGRRFYQPLSDLSEKYNIVQAALASSERIFGLLDTPLEIESPERPYRPAVVRGAIEFDDVHFSYLEGEPVLNGLSFRVEPGETVAIVGHTGAGKSTLVTLMQRFYDVDRGALGVGVFL